MNLLLGNDAALLPAAVVVTLEVEAGVDPLLDGLGQPLAEGDGNSSHRELVLLQLGQVLQQLVDLVHLAGVRLVIPLNLVKWWESALCWEAGRRVLDDKPLGLPALVGIL